MRTAIQAAKDDLQNSGIPFRIENDKGYLAEAYLPVFLRDVEGIVSNLGG